MIRAPALNWATRLHDQEEHDQQARQQPQRRAAEPLAEQVGQGDRAGPPRELADPLAEDAQDRQRGDHVRRDPEADDPAERVDQRREPDERPAAHHGRRQRHGEGAQRAVAEEILLEEAPLALGARLATTPRPSEISVKSTSATSVGGWAWIALGVIHADPLPDVALELGGVVLAQVVVGHVEPGEPEREQRADGPGDHDPPEDPRRHPQDRPDVLRPERPARADVAEQVAVGAAIHRAASQTAADDDRLAAGVPQHGVGLEATAAASGIEDLTARRGGRRAARIERSESTCRSRTTDFVLAPSVLASARPPIRGQGLLEELRHPLGHVLPVGLAARRVALVGQGEQRERLARRRSGPWPAGRCGGSGRSRRACRG